MTHDPQIDYDSFQHPMASHGMAAGKQLSDSKGASAAISTEAAVLSVRRVGRLNRSQAGDRFEISGGCWGELLPKTVMKACYTHIHIYINIK